MKAAVDDVVYNRVLRPFRRNRKLTELRRDASDVHSEPLPSRGTETLATGGVGVTVAGHKIHRLKFAPASYGATPRATDRFPGREIDCPVTIRDIPELALMTTVMSRRSRARRGRFVDVGAHCGFWTLIVGGVFESVIAFEPSSYQYSLLQRNCRLNRAQNVVTHKVALSSRSGRASIQVTGLSGGGNTLEPVTLEPLRIEDVPVATLDSFMLDEISLMKVDVEGHETSVLQGALDSIRRCRPDIVFESNTEPGTPKRLLEEAGYNVESCGTGHANMYWARPATDRIA